jgi:hypothetical protein
MFGRRLGVATTALSAASALALGLGGPASASTTLFENSNANVKFTGGESTAMNSCIADAQDGVIQDQLVACNQIATSGNLVSLDGVSVWITTPKSTKIFSADNVTLTASGGLANAINLCVADAYDGVIQNQIVACYQVANAGNLISLNNVYAMVVKP